MNFPSQRPWRHNYRLCNFHVKDPQGHRVIMSCMTAKEWFLRVTKSASHHSCCLPSMRSRKMTCKFFRSLYNKTIIRFGFCDIQNNQGLGKGYQPQPYQDIIKTSYDNCLLSCNTPTDAAPRFIWKRTPFMYFLWYGINIQYRQR